MPAEPIHASKKMDACYETIHNFFDAFSLPHSRYYLLSAIKATEKNSTWKKASPADLLYFFKRMERLLTDVATITKSGYKRKRALLPHGSVPDLAQTSLYAMASPKYGPWDYFPRSLSVKEYNNPYRALKKCMGWADAKQWNFILEDILSYALCSNTLTDNGASMEVLHTALLLQKMLEACHLIDVRTGGGS
jgi:hypothetical protein